MELLQPELHRPSPAAQEGLPGPLQGLPLHSDGRSGAAWGGGNSPPSVTGRLQPSLYSASRLLRFYCAVRLIIDEFIHTGGIIPLGPNVSYRVRGNKNKATEARQKCAPADPTVEKSKAVKLPLE